MGRPSSQRCYAVGDLQAPAQHIFDVLGGAGVLGHDGKIAADVALLSIGDYFDYPGDPVETAAREGLRVLEWLSTHPAEQVTILLGNHDLSRVMELCDLSDARFAEARSLASDYDACSDAEQRARLLAQFRLEFPRIPSPGIVSRDYSAFAQSQRDLVVELLLAGRVQLAREARLHDGTSALATHAGVTTRELSLMGLSTDAPVSDIAGSLNRLLERAVERVRPHWERGDVGGHPLDLSPVHVTGISGAEGGGLLYHRPADPDRPGADSEWEQNRDRPRRFDPRSLPAGRTQIVGHTTHKKCIKEMQQWLAADSSEPSHGRVRTLTVRDSDVVYRLGVGPTQPAAAQLLMIDGHIVHSTPGSFELLSVADWI